MMEPLNLVSRYIDMFLRDLMFPFFDFHSCFQENKGFVRQILSIFENVKFQFLTPIFLKI